MLHRVFLCAALFAVGLYMLMGSKSVATPEFYIADEISVDGPALFYAVSEGQRQELWSVYCVQPLRSCVARAPGLVLRIDEDGQPWLITVMSPGARVSVQNRNYTRNMPSIFARPLDREAIKELSGQQSFVVIEEQAQVVLRTRTTGLNKITDYLTWIRGNTAHTLRDARLWPRNGDIRIQDMTPTVLERYEVMQRRAIESQRQLVPSTKPQIEFAIRAQKGTSFYSPMGKSGY